MSESPGVITLTTDFGEGSTYVAQMKGVILGLHPRVSIVDVTHSVPPQNVPCGAFALREVFEKFPAGTIHVAVVDPGVGTARNIIGLRCGQATFIAPDNGLLTLVARRVPPSEMVRVANTQLWRRPVSATFHGRDIMAPVAAQLALGVPLDQLGPPLADYQRLPWPEVRVEPGRLFGAVVMIDSFGNVLSNIARADLPPGVPDDRLMVSCRGGTMRGIIKTYAEAPAVSELIALIGSNGALELAVAGGNAAQKAGFEVGDEVIVAWPS